MQHLSQKKSELCRFPTKTVKFGTACAEQCYLASYHLCAVSNHHGTMNSGHYISYCKPLQGDVWYQCDDKTVTRLRAPVKTSTAYLLFYDSVHADIRDIF